MTSSSIIVIGNGSSVLDKEYGKIIDDFEEVVRFNNFIIDGYEKYIGTKTTIWARSNSGRIKEKNMEWFKQVFICNPPKQFSSYKNYISARKLFYSIPNAIMLPEEEKNELQKELKLYGHYKCLNRRTNMKYGDKAGWASAGVMVLNYLVRRYSIVYIYGFDYFTKIDGNPRHYYNDMEAMPTSKMHKGERERQWIEDNANQGLIKFL